MAAYLLDTNVISETARKKPDAAVIRWVGLLPSIILPSVAIYELSAGIERVPHGKRRDFLQAWFAELMDSGCDVVPFDREAALACAQIEREARLQKRSIEHRDLLILATARSRGLGVATRNVSHFRNVGVPIYDPFTDTRYL